MPSRDHRFGCLSSHVEVVVAKSRVISAVRGGGGVLLDVVVCMMGRIRSGSGFEDLGGVRRSCICGWHYGYGDPCVRRYSKGSWWGMTDGVCHLPMSRLRPRWRMILVVVGTTNLSADG